MSNILVIDDDRTFTFDATYVRNPVDAIKALEDVHSWPWDEVWFDHDLGFGVRPGEDITIYPVVHHIEWTHYIHGFTLPISKVVIHTANPVGRMMIERALKPIYGRVHHVDAVDYMDLTLMRKYWVEEVDTEAEVK